MFLGEKIISLRKSKGISQELLAENSRVALRTIQRIEKGNTVPRPYTLKIIADALGVTVEQLQADSDIDKVDLTKIRQINLSALIILLVPIANIVLPLLLWKKAMGNQIVLSTGRRIISFQILWTVITILVLVAVQIIQVLLTNSVMTGRVSVLFPVYFFMVCLNIFFIIQTTAQLKSKSVLSIYSRIPILF